MTTWTRIMAVAVAGAAVLAGCTSAPAASSAPPSPSPSPSPSLTTGPLVDDYLPGLPAQVRVPAAIGPAPLVVLVPGGGWSAADPTGLEPLAESLTAGGATTSLITYSTTTMGATFPRPVDDVACAVRWSAAKAAELGHPASSVIIAGHSAGGHLAALVALSGDRFGGACPAPPVGIDGLVGMAGVYDVRWGVGSLDRFFGASLADDRDLWASGSPLTWAQDGTAIPDGLRVLLLHGDADQVVPLDQTTGLASALTDHGIDVTVDVVPGQTHDTIYSSDVAGAPVGAWVAAGP